MKIGIAICLFVLATAGAEAADAQRTYTPINKARIQKAGCVAYQVCQTCYRPDGTAYTCNCHMECLPGIH
jgi:hypothetical protein